MNSVLLAITVGMLAQIDVPPSPMPDIPPSPMGLSAPVAPAVTGNAMSAIGRPSQEDCCFAPASGMAIGNRLWLKPTGDLTQHQYPTPLRTYYYFRPYSHTHLSVQKDKAVSYGANPRAPYSNAIFRQVYETVSPQFLPRVDLD